MAEALYNIHRINDLDPLGNCQFLNCDREVTIDFQEFATCQNPPSRENYCKVPFSRMQQCDRDESKTRNLVSWVSIKTELQTTRQRC